MSLLNGSGLENLFGADNTGSSAIDNSAQFQQNGFVVPPIPNADGNGLPSQKVTSLRTARATREIMRWFVPETGMVSMYVNPQNITYNFKKLITPTLTKGGYVVQYWGEEFQTLNITGNTGSSGIEGLNVLYEIYRAEQLNFDAIALTMAADNSISGLNDLVDSALGNLGGIGNSIASVTNGLFGLDPQSQNVLPRNVPSLAAMATGIELYYSGWVMHGYFTNFSFTESTQHLGLFEYTIGFTVTQRRGYRVNTLPWQRSAIDGPSNNGVGGVPLSYSKLGK